MKEYYTLAKPKLAMTSHSPLHCYMFFIILLACFGAIPSSCVGLMMPPSPCLPSQEEALLKFKAGLIDPTGRLNSWQLGLDCCKWISITCDNRTGYVTAIDLHNPQNPYDRLPFDRYAKTRSNSTRLSSLGGHLDPALADLKRLQYLDLSYNTFDGKVGIPNFVGSMVELRHLDLSYAGFGGKIPPSIGNLSKLEYFNVSSLIHIDPHSRYPLSLLGAIIRRGQALTSVLSCDDLQWIGGLTSLKVISLNQVNLSMVRHQPMQVFNSLPSLEQLALSLCSFSASLNLPFSNFSSLEILDLRYTFSISEFPNWVVNTTSLRSVDISNSDFQGEVPYGLSELPYLRDVNFSHNEKFMVNCTKLFAGRWRSLELINIFDTDFNGGIPSSIGNITSLIQLAASHSSRSRDGLEGNIPKELRKLKNLDRLALKYKNFVGSLSFNVFNPNSLKFLHLSGVDLSVANLDWFCQFKVLVFLLLDNCPLKGPIPNCLLQMRTLTYLKLSNSPSLNGTFPKVLTENYQLQVLILSYNSLQGNIHEGHLQNLKNLHALDLSYNFLVFKPMSTWKPPQSLSAILLASCRVGPEFPPWLKDAANLQFLDLSSNRINGSLPGWFWEKLPSLVQLNLSHNCIQGHLPNPFTLSFQVDVIILDLGFNMFSGPLPSFTFGADYIDLSNNRLTGPLPPVISLSPDGFYYFLASNNEIDGEIPLAFGKMKTLEVLDLSKNKLMGSLWPNLETVDVSGNHLSSEANLNLPLSNVMRSLHLGQNFLGGAFPSWLKNSTSLEILDLSQNRFFGEIPTWVGTHCISLKILDLRSNMFNGQIPWQLSLLSSLQVLDVAHNSLNGSIPHSFGNFRAMKEKHVVKRWFPYDDGYYKDKLIILMSGKEDEYDTGNLGLVNSLDLSSNKFSGDIPKELTSLSELIVLNLSRNELIHDIPDNIGALKQLLTLDLSHNHLSGTLPSSLGALTFLNDLNLSYNNFSGEIPTGSQLQTFVESTYIGNPGLCGAPLMKKCLNLGNPGTMGEGGDAMENGKEEALDMFGLYVSVGPGFVVGFWCVCGTLILRTKWRSAYFRFFDEANNRIFVLLVIKLPYLLRRVLRKNKHHPQQIDVSINKYVQSVTSIKPTMDLSIIS